MKELLFHELAEGRIVLLIQSEEDSRAVKGLAKKNRMKQFQSFVDAFFQCNSSYWKYIYREESLNATIYRERKSCVLAMSRSLELPVGSHVLEVGCGAGLTTVALAECGYVVDAIDTVQAMLNLTRREARDAGVETRVKTSLNRVQKLNFPPQHFELVVAMGVLPWLETPQKALAEIGRVLKRGGHLIVTADNNWCLSQTLDPLCFPGLRPLRWKVADLLEELDLWNARRPRMYRHSIGYMDELLAQSGFSKFQSRTLGFGPFTLFKQKLIPDRIGIKLHRKFQALADAQFPAIRSAGTEYVVMARKTGTARVV